MGLFDGGGGLGTAIGTVVGGMSPIGGIAGGLLGNQVGENFGGLATAGPGYAMPPPPEELKNEMISARTEGMKQTPGTDVHQLGEQAKTAMGFNPMGEALSRRASRGFQKGMSNLERLAPTQNMLEQQQRIGTALSHEQQLNDLKRGIVAKANMAQVEQDAARYQVLTSMFGGIGQGVGTGVALERSRKG